jgi:hypothetical protein
MTQSSMASQIPLIDDGKRETSGAQPLQRLTFFKFLQRYPIFILAFGPPLFRSSAVDVTRGILDVWSFFQVGLLAAVTFRAIRRLVAPQIIFIPRQVRPIFGLAFVLGLLFLASSIYSPSRLTTVAYSILYFSTMICVLEFVVDVYRHPLDWIQCLLFFRSIGLLLVALAVLVFPFKPSLIVSYSEQIGMRIGGGLIAPFPLIFPIGAIISAYAFLYSLEPRGRSLFYFLLCLAGTLMTRARGGEISLLLPLVILGFGWSKTSKRSAYLFVSGIMASALLTSLTFVTIGVGRIWSLFNKGQSAEGIKSASGRTDMWHFVIQYCMAHPQGMGYVAGFREHFKQYYVLGMQLDPTHIGNAHNVLMQLLADAGWLALAVYLIMFAKIVFLAWRNTSRKGLASTTSNIGACHAIRCSLLLLICCFIGGLDAADFDVPMRQPFYWQNIIIAIILGASATLAPAMRQGARLRENSSVVNL